MLLSAVRGPQHSFETTPTRSNRPGENVERTARQPSGRRFSFRLSKGSVTHARDILEDVGITGGLSIEERLSIQGRSSSRSSVIVQQVPPPGTSVAPNTVVSVRLSNAAGDAYDDFWDELPQDNYGEPGAHP